MAIDGNGHVTDRTAAVTWSCSPAGVATISNASGSAGLATGIATGSTIITAVDPASGLFGETTLTVNAAVLVSLAVTPTNPTIPVGLPQQFTATGTFSDNSTQDLTTLATWSSTNTGVATVSNALGSEGLATSVAVGAVTMRATHVATGIFGTTLLTVASNIAFQAAAAAGSGPGILSLTVTTPTGTVAGDVMVAAIAVRPNTATITPPASGWTLVRRVDNSASVTNSLAIYTRVAGVGEPASHTWTFSSSTGSAGGIMSFRGVDATTPVDVENGQSTANGLSHASPSVITTVDGTMLVTAHAFASSASWTPPAGMTEAFDVASGVVPLSSGMSIEGNYVLQLTAGATGSRTAVAGNDSDVGNAHILALRRLP